METDGDSVETRRSYHDHHRHHHHHHPERRAAGVVALLSYRAEGEARRFRDRWDGQELRWRQRQLLWQQEDRQAVRFVFSLSCTAVCTHVLVLHVTRLLLYTGTWYTVFVDVVYTRIRWRVFAQVCRCCGHFGY